MWVELSMYTNARRWVVREFANCLRAETWTVTRPRHPVNGPRLADCTSPVPPGDTSHERHNHIGAPPAACRTAYPVSAAAAGTTLYFVHQATCGPDLLRADVRHHVGRDDRGDWPRGFPGKGS